MQNVYIVWDIEYDDKGYYAGKLIDGIYDSEEKAIEAIQRSVRQIRRICEKLGGPKNHVTYLIGHVPVEDDIRGKEVHYQTIDGCKQILRYEVYCMM